MDCVSLLGHVHFERQGRQLRSVCATIVQAVHTIHEARIVHSDLKPANFLVVEGQLKLIDFGIAKAISSDTTSIAREAQVSGSHFTPEVLCLLDLSPCMSWPSVI